MSKKIEMTVDQLEQLLKMQRLNCADYIKRNLSVYSFYKKSIEGNDILDKVKNELFDECIKADFPQDFLIIKKYL